MKIIRLLGTDVYLNPFFLGVLALFFAAGVLVKGLIAFSIVFLHELAHVAVARRLEITVEQVELLPFGGVARVSGEIVNNPYKEVKVAVAGPACNLVLIFLALVLRNNHIWNGELLSFFIQCNLLVALFNLLPALPLDGGRAYRAFLAPRMGLSRATFKAAAQGQKWAVFLFLLGCAGIYSGATGIDISLTALFVFYAATREKNTVPYLVMKHLVRKKDELQEGGILPARILVALEDVPLGKIVKGFLPQRYHLVMVVNSSGEYTGRVTESQIVDTIMDGSMEVTVGDLKKP